MSKHAHFGQSEARRLREMGRRLDAWATSWNEDAPDGLPEMTSMGQSGGRSLVERLQAKDRMEAAREDLADVDVPEATPTVLKLDGLIDDMNEPVLGE